MLQQFTVPSALYSSRGWLEFALLELLDLLGWFTWSLLFDGIGWSQLKIFENSLSKSSCNPPSLFGIPASSNRRFWSLSQTSWVWLVYEWEVSTSMVSQVFSSVLDKYFKVQKWPLSQHSWRMTVLQKLRVTVSYHGESTLLLRCLTLGYSCWLVQLSI